MRFSIEISLLSVLVCGSGAFLNSPPQRPLATQPSGADHDAFQTDALPFSTAALEGYIEDVLERWHAAGMAVAIINGNETWAKGFGYASLSSSTPVTPHTLFFTGSTTKSFTAAGLSLLIDNSSDYSSIKWTTPFSSLLPEEFVLSDEWSTAHITLEDALCHRTGYPRHDLAVGNDTRTMIRSLRHLPMSAEPRTRFQYNNMMFGAAGYLISKLTGSTLRSFFHRHLWEPMGMNETFLNINDPSLRDSGLPVADAYWWVNSTREYVRQPMSGEELLADEGAGAVVSNVLDYVKYLRVMMAEAGPISEAGHRELKTPRMFTEFEKGMFSGPVTYGLGWMSGIFEGEKVYFHSGTVTPFVASMLMVPSKNYGIVTMANSYSKVRELVTYRILYDLFGVEQDRRRDLETQFQHEEALAKQALETCAERLYPRIPIPPIPASVPLVNHTGQYRHAAYGDVFTGDFWISWLSIEEIPDTGLGCLRTQFIVDAGGFVTQMGVDLRMEGEDVPLVWFERV
ncbi:D-aminopeptidase [Cytospora mali]|uniref:D-aminopeptidase n=1 Tax=Cytospora mali TaxID=578113 RepID=A0A194UYG9_CYTMA|nr:D-aminopeptidase [Valsa mali var. pyri (nom. inval.)]